MMEVYRICRSKYSNDLSGEGAKLYGGRWNRPGIAALYTSESRALALLELIVHFNSANALCLDYDFLALSIDETQIVSLCEEVQDYESQNKIFPYQEKTEVLFLEKQVLAIKVPSVIIPQEYNIIINPTHQGMKSIHILTKEKVMMDKRLRPV
ncbi:MAG: RES family NAD+ phosphorylase [Saprospiraceae bacterium]|jgi:RES domain-containing protein|nr:RES family NAD+ phosphorylase [Saprospiraceae bacterium]